MAGFGASGRNGGWSSALFPTSWERLVDASSEAGALRMHRAMQDTVREVGRVAAAEGIDAQYHRGGNVTLARTPVQLERLRDEVRTAHARGFTEEDHRLLEPDEASAMLAATPVLGGVVHPPLRRHPPVPAGARTGPGRRGERGVDLRAAPRCCRIAPGRVETEAGTVQRGGGAAGDRGLHPRARGDCSARSCRCTR